ncbi:hypothetical protein [Escherichia coli]|uniref:hypothetical protein n=1 Tax=Escherichia coli TaxID=562 RepID=UPI000245F123|nr:hypothetical protein [Escherichia coli]EHN85835.1 hypothetical protein ESRG_02275 [Escherichia coli TA124]
MWNIMVLMNIYIADWQRKSFFHALFLQIFLYGRRFCCGLIHKEMHLDLGLKSSWLMLLCRGGRGNLLYRYALAIACAADRDEMPIKKPEFDEGRTQASVNFYSNTPRRVG